MDFLAPVENTSNGGRRVRAPRPRRTPPKGKQYDVSEKKKLEVLAKDYIRGYVLEYLQNGDLSGEKQQWEQDSDMWGLVQRAIRDDPDVAAYACQSVYTKSGLLTYTVCLLAELKAQGRIGSD